MIQEAWAAVLFIQGFIRSMPSLSSFFHSILTLTERKKQRVYDRQGNAVFCSKVGPGDQQEGRGY